MRSPTGLQTIRSTSAGILQRVCQYMSSDHSDVLNWLAKQNPFAKHIRDINNKAAPPLCLISSFTREVLTLSTISYPFVAPSLMFQLTKPPLHPT